MLELLLAKGYAVKGLRKTGRQLDPCNLMGSQKQKLPAS